MSKRNVCKKDEHESINWFLKVVEQGDSSAQYDLESI